MALLPHPKQARQIRTQAISDGDVFIELPQREVPHRALTLKQTSVAGDSAQHKENNAGDGS
jgi:hypothetical protein